jgi:hypothetical protein
MRFCNFVRSSFVVAAVLGGLALGPRTVLAHGDVWLYTDAPNNTLGVGVVDETATVYTPDERVFESILTPDGLPFSPFDFSSTEPGFRAAAGDLPASQPIGLTVDWLKVWNGAGLDPVIDASFSFDLSGGFSSAADGSLHDHALFGLTAATASPVADGVYVASIRAAMAGLNGSEPFYLVMLKDDLIATEDDAEELAELLEAFEAGGPPPVFAGKDFSFFEEAVEFVEAIPEPRGLALAAVGAILVGAHRRRT